VGHRINWYGNSKTGGTPSSNPPIPMTTDVGVSEFYVSQTNNSTGCESNRSKISFTVLPIPGKPIVTRDGNGNLLSSYTSGNQWFREGVPIQGAVGQTYKPVDAALYSVVSKQNGCLSPVSDSYYYLTTALINFNNGQFIHLYPNPVTDVLKISMHFNSIQQLTILMFDQTGKKLGVWNRRSSLEIDMSKYTSGFFHFIFKKSDGTTLYNARILKIN
jgi:hypothetical protein